MTANQELQEAAKLVLANNDRGQYTEPARGLYPHQWLWDSCFIAIGLRHVDVGRAQSEILSLLRGQWTNGMLPNIIFRDGLAYRPDRNVWKSRLNPAAPKDVATSGITQPPLLAEAVVRVGEKLAWPERREWYKQVYPALLKYHEWLYNERDPHKEGLVLQIHPWETGLDNTPPWTAALHEHQLPAWISLTKKTRGDQVLNLLRRDTRSVPLDQRYSTIEVLILFDMQRRLRRKAYDINKILDHALLTVEDLSFNSIFIRANQHLRHIAHSLQETLPANLLKRMHRTEQALDELWDTYSEQYYSRDFVTHHLLKVPTIATLLPLYSGAISERRAAALVKLLENAQLFHPAYPVPSVPVNSYFFRPKLYWQGPTWVNTNWLIIDGLERYDYKAQAAQLRESTLAMVSRAGCYEYFDPLTGEGAGARDFSWTAALTLDLLNY